MSPTRVGIDLAQSPLQVGGLVIGKFIVQEGSKGVKFSVEGGAKREEVTESLEDARSVVKSYFGAPNYDAAVLVVPNNTSREHCNEIIGYGQGAYFNIAQLIYEHTAVASAFVDKVKPTENTTLAIISLSAGILDISVVSIVPIEVRTLDYKFYLEEHKVDRETIDFEESGQPSGGLIGFVGGAVEKLIVDPLEKVYDILKNVLGDLRTDKQKVEKIVFVGKAAKSEKVKQAVKERFPHSEVWEGIDDPYEVAAYGAASVAYMDKTVIIQKGAVISSVPIPEDGAQL